MNWLCVYVFLLYNFSSGSSVHPKHRIESRISIIDVFYENVQKEIWRKEDQHCYNEILAVLNNARNSTLWATWVLDSISLPTGVLYGCQYQLGNFDECMKAPWLHTHPDLRTQYCLADVQLTNVESTVAGGDQDPQGLTEIYIKSRTQYARKFNTITWGVCAPSTCSSEGVSSFLKALLRSTHLAALSPSPQIKVDECQIAGKPLESGVGAKIFWYMILTLFLIAVTSTWYLAKSSNADSDYVGTELAKCFCMNRNAHELVKPSGEDIPMLHGCRSLTAMITVFAHQLFFANSGAVVNGLDVDKDLERAFFLMHTDILTDTFLFMSGLLLAKSVATKDKLENPLSVLWKRYIRLIGPMAVLVFYLTAVSLHTGSGPIWRRLAGKEQQMCAKNWWISLLMLNNYVNNEEMCFITLWYVPADYQLSILGVALIYICRAHHRLGTVTVATVAVLTLLLPATATYWWSIPATIIYNIETAINIRGNINFNSTYTKSHYRIGSYILGLGLGTFMAIYKPTLHRNYISKKWSIITFITVFIMGLIPFCLGGVFYTRQYSAMEAAIYCATNRIVWATAFGGLVVACEYGNLPIVNDLLSWKAWVPLSRLSYGLYLTHPVVILYNVFAARNPMRHHPFTMLSDSFGPIVLGYIFSLIIWLLVQAPISNLTSYFYRKPVKLTQVEKKKEVTGNGVEKKKDFAGNFLVRNNFTEKEKSL